MIVFDKDIVKQGTALVEFIEEPETAGESVPSSL